MIYKTKRKTIVLAHPDLETATSQALVFPYTSAHRDHISFKNSLHGFQTSALAVNPNESNLLHFRTYRGIQSHLRRSTIVKDVESSLNE